MPGKKMGAGPKLAIVQNIPCLSSEFLAYFARDSLFLPARKQPGYDIT